MRRTLTESDCFSNKAKRDGVLAGRTDRTVDFSAFRAAGFALMRDLESKLKGAQEPAKTDLRNLIDSLDGILADTECNQTMARDF